MKTPKLISFKLKYKQRRVTNDSTLVSSFDCMDGLTSAEVESALERFKDNSYTLNVVPVTRTVFSVDSKEDWSLRVYSHMSYEETIEYAETHLKKLLENNSVYSDKKIKYIVWLDIENNVFMTFNTIFCSYIRNLLKLN